MVEHFVGGDPVKPCVQLCISSESGQCGPYLDENVLKKVVGVFVTVQETAHVPIEPFGIGLDYTVESLLLPSATVELYDVVVCHLC